MLGVLLLGLAGPAAAADSRVERLHSALTLVRAERAALLEYYEGDTSLLRGAHISPPSVDTRLSARLSLLALGEKKRLVIGAAGSSVTAGHDAFVNAAYPAVLERLLAPTVKALGAELVVRNGGKSGINPLPTSLCIAPMLGSDVDVVLREWEYWPYSAGIDARLLAKPGASADMAGLELFLRAALSVESQPSVHLVQMNVHGSTAPPARTAINNWLRPPRAHNHTAALGALFDRLYGSGGQKSELGALADYARFSIQARALRTGVVGWSSGLPTSCLHSPTHCSLARFYSIRVIPICDYHRRDYVYDSYIIPGIRPLRRSVQPPAPGRAAVQRAVAQARNKRDEVRIPRGGQRGRLPRRLHSAGARPSSSPLNGVRRRLAAAIFTLAYICNSSVTRQDGHHQYARWTLEHGLSPELLHKRAIEGLFVNWHPSMLGHEVWPPTIRSHHQQIPRGLAAKYRVTAAR